MWSNHFTHTCNISHFIGTSKTNVPSYSPLSTTPCNKHTKWEKKTENNVTTTTTTTIYRIRNENLTVKDKVDDKLITSLVPYCDFNGDFSHFEVTVDD